MAALAVRGYDVTRIKTGQHIPIVIGFNNCWQGEFLLREGR